MAWKVSEKSIKIHTIIDGVNYVEDKESCHFLSKAKSSRCKT